MRRNQAQALITQTRRVDQAPVLIKIRTKVTTTVIVIGGPIIMKVAQIIAAAIQIKTHQLQVHHLPGHRRKSRIKHRNLCTRLRPTKVRWTVYVRLCWTWIVLQLQWTKLLRSIVPQNPLLLLIITEDSPRPGIFIHLDNMLAVKRKKALPGKYKLLTESQSIVIMMMKITKMSLILRRLCPAMLLSPISYLTHTPETKLEALNGSRIHHSSRWPTIISRRQPTNLKLILSTVLIRPQFRSWALILGIWGLTSRQISNHWQDSQIKAITKGDLVVGQEPIRITIKISKFNPKILNKTHLIPTRTRNSRLGHHSSSSDCNYRPSQATKHSLKWSWRTCIR